VAEWHNEQVAKLSFRYTAPPLAQGLTTLLQVGAAAAVVAHPASASAWRTLIETVPEVVLIVVVPVVGHLLLYWGAVFAFGYVDRNDAPGFVARHRIQSGTPRRPPMEKVLPNLAVNQLVLSPLLLLALWGLLWLRGWSASPVLPSLSTLLLEQVGLSLCAMVWFYASHRFLHRPWWMKRVHRVHHEFRTTSAIASEYSHWFEFVFSSFGTLTCGVVLLAPSLVSIYLFELVAITTILVHHSGYALPWASWSVHHDWHHYRYKECFGTIGVLDRLLGTDEELKTLTDGQRV